MLGKEADNLFGKEDEFLGFKDTLERKRPNYMIAILPLLIVLILAGIVLVVSLFLYPSLRDDTTDGDSDGTLCST